MGRHVFICYAREDWDPFVRGLATNLKAAGVRVWVDQWDILAGADWDLAIEKALKSCAHFLIVLSPNAVVSPEVQGELRIALHNRKHVVPVLYQDCEIPVRLRDIEYVDFKGRSPDNFQALQGIVIALRTEATRARRTRILLGVLLTVVMLSLVALWLLRPWDRERVPTAATGTATSALASSPVTATPSHTPSPTPEPTARVPTHTPTSMATEAPTLAATYTATPSTTPEAISTPSFTPVPTLTSVATATSVSISTNTPTLAPTRKPPATPTPTPRWLPAPQLLAPPDAASFGGWNAKVILQWSGVAGLRQDEYYVVRIPYKDEYGESVAEFWRKATSFQVPGDFGTPRVGFDDRHYNWTVQVMRCTMSCDRVLDDNMRKQGVAVGSASGEGMFYWHPDIGGPRPTNTPATPGSTQECAVPNA